MIKRLRPLAILHLVLALCIVSVMSCDRSSNGGKAPVKIRFWNGFTGPDGREMLALIKQFNESNPDIYVTMQRMDWGLYYNKLFVAGIGGRAPEVFVVHADSLARFTRANFVRPVDDLVGKKGIVDPADFDENVWHATERDGKHWSVPLDIHLLGMFYNRAMFRKAGIIDAKGEAKPPTNREEFIDDLRKLKGINGPDSWGFVYTWQRTNIYTCIRQNGGDMFNADHTKTTINSPQNVEALQWCADLVLKEHLAPAPQDFDAWVGFLQGKVGIAFEGIYTLPDLRKQDGKLDYAAAPVPQLFKQPAAWANSHSLCFRADLSGPELEAAKRFVKFLSDHTLDWAAAGQVPVRKSLRASERFQHMNEQREFAKEIPYAAYFPAVPFNFEYLTEYEYAIEKALRESETPQQALDSAAVKITRIMNRYNGDSGANP
jgi:multiple sugar transport system substrate-binding protein